MAYAALDLGQRRIGLAVTDAAGIAVHPVGVVERRSTARDFEALAKMLAGRDVTTIVVGLPLMPDGSEGAGARSARRFAEQLAATLGPADATAAGRVTVEMFDERLTSFEAEERLKGSTVRRRGKKAAVDALAAVVILESWLQSRSPK